MFIHVARCYGAARVSSLKPTGTERRLIRHMVDEGLLVQHPDRAVALTDADLDIVTCRRVGGGVS